jgi:hypothetical protein
VCSLSLANLPATGTYSVFVSRAYSSQYVPMSFTATVAQDASASLTVGTAYNLSLSKTGQDGLLTFTATAGQNLALEITNVATTPANSNVSINVTGPGASGPGVAGGSVTSASGTTFNLANLAAGTYTVFVNPATTSTSMTITLLNNPTVALETTGASANVSDVAGEDAYLTFSGTAGQNLTFALSNLVLSSGYASVTISEPNGSQWISNLCSPGGVCSLSLANLPATGTYSVFVSRAYSSQYVPMSFTADVAQDVAATLAVGTPDNLSLPKTGQDGLLTFTATAGQTLALDVTNVVTTPASSNVSINITGPGASGTSVGGGNVTSAAGTIFNLANLAAGTYTVFVNPSTTSTSLTLTLLNNPTVSLPTTGSGVNVSELAGENAYLSFSGTAGQNLTFTISNLVMPSGYVYVYVNAPNNGGTILGSYCYFGTAVCSINLRNLPATGTYGVEVTAAVAGVLPMSFTANVAQDVTASLTVGTPETLSLPKTGQDGIVTFTATAGQTQALEVTSVVTTPAGSSVSLGITGPGTSGTSVGSGSVSSASGTSIINLPNLAAGTYTVFVNPSTTSASMTFTLLNNATVALPTTGSGVGVSELAGENAYLSFNGTAGQNLTFTISNLVMPSGYVYVYVNAPNNGGTILGSYCYLGTAVCSISLENLPSTGTYGVEVTAAFAGLLPMSFTANVAQDATATLTQGTPYKLTLNEVGQDGWLTFTIGTTTTVNLQVTGITTSPANNNVTIDVYNAAGSTVTGVTTTTSTTLSMSNLAAGTYSVLLHPSALSASMSVQF